VIELQYAPSLVTLCIEDDGAGFNPAEVLRPGAGLAWGLIGIQERVTLAGGEVDIHSTPGQGTRIVVSVPTLLDEFRQAEEQRRAERARTA
jgi:signal transduction histidine kinase